MKIGILILFTLALSSCGDREHLSCVEKLPGFRDDYKKENMQFYNTVEIKYNKYYWNGVPHRQSTIVDFLKKTKNQNPPPALILRYKRELCGANEKFGHDLSNVYNCYEMNNCFADTYVITGTLRN